MSGLAENMVERDTKCHLCGQSQKALKRYLTVGSNFATLKLYAAVMQQKRLRVGRLPIPMLDILFRSSKVSLYGRIVFVYVEMAEHDVISWHGDSMSTEVDRHYIFLIVTHEGLRALGAVGFESPLRRRLFFMKGLKINYVNKMLAAGS